MYCHTSIVEGHKMFTIQSTCQTQMSRAKGEILIPFSRLSFASMTVTTSVFHQNAVMPQSGYF